MSHYYIYQYTCTTILENNTPSKEYAHISGVLLFQGVLISGGPYSGVPLSVVHSENVARGAN